eukprot:189367_1
MGSCKPLLHMVSHVLSTIDINFINVPFSRWKVTMKHHLLYATNARMKNDIYLRSKHWCIGRGIQHKQNMKYHVLQLIELNASNNGVICSKFHCHLNLQNNIMNKTHCTPLTIQYIACTTCNR